MDHRVRTTCRLAALIALVYGPAMPAPADMPQAKKTAPAAAAGPRSAVSFGFGGKIAPGAEGSVPGFDSYKLRFGPGDWEGARIIITSAWGDKDPAHYWNWPDGPGVRASDALRDKDGWYFVYSLEAAHADDWVVASFLYALRDGRGGVAGALFPHGGSPAIPQEGVAALGFDGRLGPSDEGYVPEFDSYRLRFGPGDWSGTRITRSMTWGEGSEPIDHWGWRDHAEDKVSDVRTDFRGAYFIHSLKSAGHSRWTSSLFRFERKDGRHGVARSVHSYMGGLASPQPAGQVAGMPVAPPASPSKLAAPTARTLASARLTRADLEYLQKLGEGFKKLDMESLAKVEHMDLAGTAIDDAGMVHLRGLKHLETLSLRGTHVGDAGIANLAGLSGLQKLNLIETPLTDAGLQAVGRLVGLTELNIDQTSVTDAGLRSLQKLPNLQVLSLVTTDVGDAGLRSLGSLPNLRSIVLGKDSSYRSEPITGVGLKSLRSAPKLTSWHLTYLPIGDDDVAVLRGASQIRVLDISNTKITDASIAHLQTMKGLEELRLQSTAVTPRGLAGLKGIPQLKYLFLGYADVGDAGMAALAPLTNLEVLSVTKGNVTDAGLVHLRGMTKLDRLFLPDNQITGPGLANLRGLVELFNLNLYANQLDDASLAVLPSLPKLRHLYLSGEKITDRGLVPLRQLPDLHFLDISWTKVTEAGLADLKKALPELHIDHGDH